MKKRMMRKKNKMEEEKATASLIYSRLISYKATKFSFTIYKGVHQANENYTST